MLFYFSTRSTPSFNSVDLSSIPNTIVAIEHTEIEGTVALEGKDLFDFSDRVFH